MIDDNRYLLDPEARGYKSKYERDEEKWDEDEQRYEDERHETQDEED